MKKILYILFIFISCTACGQTTDEKFNAEKLLEFKSPKEVSDFYGAENVKSENAYDGENNLIGMAIMIYPKTNNEVQLNFDSFTSEFTRAIFTKPNSQWKLPMNLKIGKSLNELKKINGKDFTIYGFETDYAGACFWEGGNLAASGVAVSLSADENSAVVKDYKKYQEVMGDKHYSSSNEIIVQMGLTISEINIINKVKK